MGNASRYIGYLILISTLVAGLTPICATAQEIDAIVPSVLGAKDPKLIYRLDLMTGKLDPIDQRDLKVGYVYHHYSSPLKRWAWSYCRDDHSFWHAYGEGTTQNAWCFDIRASRVEVAKRLEEFPDLAHQVDTYNRSVCLQLQADGRWKIIGVGRLPSIFDVETGERWQMFSKDEYIPVLHTRGRTWTVRNGDYYPSN